MTTLLTARPTGNRVFGLDLLRAFAILGVVAMHGNELLPEGIRNFCTKFVFFFDWVGMFFVLSGFLVGRILIRDMDQGGDIPAVIIRFWIRRWLRTLPAYFVVLLVLVAVQVGHNPAFSISTVWKYPLFLQNFASPIPMFFVESWSLSVEEWFYLLVPLMVGALMKFGRLSHRSAIIIVAVLIILFCNGMRLYRYWELQPRAELIVYILNTRLQVVTRLDGIMFGLLAALWSQCRPEGFLRHKKPLLLAGLALWLFTAYLRRFYPENVEIYMDSFYWWVVDFTVVSMATVFSLPYLSDWRSAKGSLQEAIAWISIHSYSMYLVNLSLVHGYVLDIVIPWSRYVDDADILVASRYVTFWMAVFVLSILLYRFCELPMMRLRDNKALNAVLERLRPNPRKPSSS